MSFVPIGYGEVTFKFRAVTLSRDATCVLGLDTSGSGIANAEDLAVSVNTIATLATKIFAPASMSATWQYRGVRALLGQSGDPQIFDLNVSTAGTLVADPMPPNNSVLVQKRSAVGGRRNRGRMYLPPFHFAETTVDSVGTIAGATVTALQTKVTALRTDLLADDLIPVILHSVSEVAPTVIASFVVENVIATQRRRLRR